MTQNSRGRSFVPTRVAGRVVAAGLSAGLAVSALGVVAATSASATSSVTVTRAAGATRYLTAVDVSQKTFRVNTGDPAITNVVIASGENFPDGLAASALAGKLGSPVLLVPAVGAAPQAVKDELTRLGATTVTVVGGTGAVSDATVASLGVANVVRVAGQDRYATAVAVAAAIGKANIGSSDLDGAGGAGAEVTAIVARGDLYADALAASALANKGHHPIFLTNPSTLTPVTKDALAAFGIQRVIIMGGTGAVSTPVEDAIKAAGIETVRVAGTDRYDTARKLADVLVSSNTQLSYAGLTGTVGFSAEGAVVATALDFPDALAAGPHAAVVNPQTAPAAAKGGPILFVRGGTVPTSTKDFFTLNRNTLSHFTVVGGTGVVPDSAVSALKAAATTPTTPAPSAADGLYNGVVVKSVNKATNTFIGTSGTGGLTADTQFAYDSNDFFQIAGANDTQANFVAKLSTGDTVNVDYRSANVDQSIFNLTTDATPAVPTGVTATDDSDATGKPAGAAVSIAFTSTADSVNIYRTMSLTGDGTDCAAIASTSYVKVASATSSPYRDTSVGYATQYCYTVAAVVDGQEGNRATPVTVKTANAPASADTIAPTIVDARVASQGTGSGLLLDAGDTFTVVLSEPIAAVAAGDTIRVADSDGTIADLVNGSGSTTFALNASAQTVNNVSYAANRVLTVTVGTPVTLAAGSLSGISIPATITAQAGLADAAGNNVAISGDTSIN
ncbi:MAG: cell wall-binding repeat-containing protein [Motilibacteraceae bacterium]